MAEERVLVSRLPPEAEQKYQQQLKDASDETYRVAMMLQRAANVSLRGSHPAPLYIEQAMSLTERVDDREALIKGLQTL